MLPLRREDRRSSRRLTRRHAEITFSAQESPVRCVIWDMSDGGARLSVAHPLAGLPHTFTLALFKDASVQRNCEVVWTDTKYVGVKFISEWYGITRSGLRSNGHDARRI
jgi:PilZ domain-containing protein